jgi:hypothetical protein
VKNVADHKKKRPSTADKHSAPRAGDKKSPTYKQSPAGKAAVKARHNANKSGGKKKPAKTSDAFGLW